MKKIINFNIYFWLLLQLLMISTMMSKFSFADDVLIGGGCKVDPPCIPRCCTPEDNILLMHLPGFTEMKAVAFSAAEESAAEADSSDDVGMCGNLEEVPSGVLENRTITNASSGVLLFNWTKDGVKKHQGICSGTLVAPNLFITAAHCIAPTVKKGPTHPRHPVNFMDPKQAKHWSVFLQGYGVVDAVNTILIPDEYIAKSQLSCFYGEIDPEKYSIDYDIAIVELSEDVTNIQPMKIVSAENIRGKNVDFVGFGISENSLAVGTKSKLENKLIYDSEEHYEIDLKSKCEDEQLSVKIPKSYAIHEPTTQAELGVIAPSVCSGDSGGSVIYKNKVSDSLELVGNIVGGTAENCGLFNNEENETLFYFVDYTESLYKEFIEEYISDLGHEWNLPKNFTDKWKNRLFYGILFREGALEDESYPDRENSVMMSHQVDENVKTMHISLNGKIECNGSISEARYNAIGDPMFKLTLIQPDNTIYEGKAQCELANPGHFLGCRINDPMPGNWNLRLSLDSVNTYGATPFLIKIEDPSTYQLYISETVN